MKRKLALLLSGVTKFLVLTSTKPATLRGKCLHNIPWLVIFGIGLFNLGRGGFHWLAPDSGAGSVAGMNLSYANADDVIFLLASVGIIQMFFGIWYLYFAFWQRSLISFALATQVTMSSIIVLTEYTFKHPVAPIPGRFAHWAVLTIAAIALLISSNSRHVQQ